MTLPSVGKIGDHEKTGGRVGRAGDVKGAGLNHRKRQLLDKTASVSEGAAARLQSKYVKLPVLYW